jgi:hypothetical protein
VDADTYGLVAKTYGANVENFMIEETNITDEIDAEFWQRVEFWMRECDEAERDEAAAMNTPEAVAENNEFIRRMIAKYEADELCQLELENSPERIAENKWLFELLAASDDELTD